MADNGGTATPYYQDDLVTIYHGDCFALRSQFLLDHSLPDLVVTDPPYGIGWKPRVNHQNAPWQDTERPDVWRMLFGEHNLVWGGNYFTDQLPVSESWFLWIKRPESGFDGDLRSYSTVEMAWSDYGGKPRVRNHVWDGGKRAGDPSNREFSHPAQKPLEIMRWCIQDAPNNPRSVLDPFMGSGTTLVAAKSLGVPSVGIEIEERYCEIAANRCRQEVLGLAG